MNAICKSFVFNFFRSALATLDTSRSSLTPLRISP